MKTLALLSVLLLSLALGLVVVTDKEHSHISISERAASRRWSYIVFTVSLTVFGSLLEVYLLRSFGPRFGLPVVYYIGLFAGWAFLLLTAWIPDKGLRSFESLHWRTAFGLACSMTVMTASLAVARHVGVTVRIFAAAVSLWYCYTLYVWLSKTKAYQLYLQFEALNIACFISLLALTLFFR